MKRVYTGKQVVATQAPDINFIDNVIDLGLLIKHKRTSLGMSIQKTALLCEISDKSLRSLEKGNNVTTDTLFKVVNILSLKVNIDG